MGLQPIDLQAVFLHMNQPAKDQAVTRDAVVQSQNAQANKLVEQSLKTQDDVTAATNDDDKELKINDKEGREFEKQESKEHQKRDSEPTDDQEVQKQVFTDERLGRKIDLTG